MPKHTKCRVLKLLQQLLVYYHNYVVTYIQICKCFVYLLRCQIFSSGMSNGSLESRGDHRDHSFCSIFAWQIFNAGWNYPDDYYYSYVYSLAATNELVHVPLQRISQKKIDHIITMQHSVQLWKELMSVNKQVIVLNSRWRTNF